MFRRLRQVLGISQRTTATGIRMVLTREPSECRTNRSIVRINRNTQNVVVVHGCPANPVKILIREPPSSQLCRPVPLYGTANHKTGLSTRHCVFYFPTTRISIHAPASKKDCISGLATCLACSRPCSPNTRKDVRAGTELWGEPLNCHKNFGHS